MWGATTDPTHSVLSMVSPKDAATSEFYKDRQQSNPLIANIEARRLQIRSGDTSVRTEIKTSPSPAASMPKESVILNFQKEYLRHKRVVCTLTKLTELYFNLDVHYRKFAYLTLMLGYNI